MYGSHLFKPKAHSHYERVRTFLMESLVAALFIFAFDVVSAVVDVVPP